MQHTDGESPSDDEKKLGVDDGKLDSAIHGGLPPDPDAHLTEAERIAIVCTLPAFSYFRDVY